MRAIGLYEFGGPEKLQLLELPDPEPGEGQVVIRAEATTVNPTDSTFAAGRQAQFFEGRPRPLVPGMEVAGTIAAVGTGAPWQVGDRVIAITGPVRPTGGAHAELVLVPADSVSRAPEAIDPTEAATIPMNGLTVRLALDTLALEPGQTLGITGAAGVVGRYAIELGRAAGLTIVAQTAAKDEDDARALGAHHWVDRHADWTRAMWDVTGRGVDAILDAGIVGGPAQAAVADGGQIAAVRAFEGETERGITVHQIMVSSYFRRHDVLEDLVRLAESGELTLKVGTVLRPDQVHEAHALLAGGGHRGRIVLDWR